MRYFLLLRLLSLLVNADLLNYKCEDYTNKDSCISHIYCGWCNNTINSVNNSKNHLNNTFTCDTIGICGSEENCYTNSVSMCSSFNLFLKIVIICILVGVTFTILLTISNMLKRTNNRNIVNSIILFLVASFIVIPLVVLYYYNPNYFIYIVVVDIILCVLIWIFYGGKMIIYNNSSYTEQYIPINQHTTDIETSSSVTIN